jgi:hypothetical protein
MQVVDGSDVLDQRLLRSTKLLESVNGLHELDMKPRRVFCVLERSLLTPCIIFGFAQILGV